MHVDGCLGFGGEKCSVHLFACFLGEIKPENHKCQGETDRAALLGRDGGIATMDASRLGLLRKLKMGLP